MNDSPLARTIELIDEANAKDPNMIEDGANQRPAELVYGERMTARLEQFCDRPSDHIQIAVRAQHIERWTSPRSTYPEGRVGYLKWRKDLKAYHAQRTGELMLKAGFDKDDIARVGTLIRKEGIKRDAEAQTLEDIACLVFLEHYAEPFIAPHDDDKVIDILRKTARKMSSEGLAAAGKIPMSDRLTTLLGKSLEPAQ